MAAKLIPSTNYKSDLAKILNGIIDHALRNGDNAIPVLSFFRKEERELHRRIKDRPLAAGVDFPKPLKKGTTKSGNYVILYTYLPPSALTNQSVIQVNLDSIIPTATDAFNEMVLGLEKADLDQ